MSDKLINDLKEAIADGARKPLIVCGAGLSTQATNGDAPSWVRLLESGIQKVVDLDPEEEAWANYSRVRLGKAKAADWIEVADELTERLGGRGNAEFGEWIEASVGHLAIKSRDLLDAIRSLGCPVATTNYDNVLAKGLDKPPITWDDPDQVHRFLTGRLDGVLHLHGHWLKPKTIILGSASYEELNQDARKETLSQFAALDRPAVYIGCSADGLDDPDFTHLADFVKAWQGSAPRSYWLVRQDQMQGARSPVTSDSGRLYPIAFGEEHGELPAFVRSLAPPDPASVAAPPPPAPAVEFVSIEQQQPRPEIFGRDPELQDIEAALAEGRSAVIGGGPGFGKTALAVAAMYRPEVVKRFGRRRLFVSLEAEREPRALLASLAGALGLASGGEEASLLRQIQLAAESAPLVAVLDNAEGILETDRIEAERILGVAAQIRNLSIILTTRGAPPRLPGAVPIRDLSKLDPAAARNAFLAIDPAYAEDPDLAPLIEALDGHALSIDLVAARASSSGSLRVIREAWKELEAGFLTRIGEEESRLTSVRASLALSLESKLLAKAPLAKRLLALLAALPAGLSRDAVPRLLGERGKVTKAKAHETISVLQQLRLIERRTDDRLRMLTPLRESARELKMTVADRDRMIVYYCEIAAEGENIGRAGWPQVQGKVEPEAGNFDSVLRLALAIAPYADETLLAIGGATEYYKFSGQGTIEIIDFVIPRYDNCRNLTVVAALYSKMAYLAKSRREYELARNLFTSGMNLAAASKSYLYLGNCYLGLAEVLKDTGDQGEAERYLPLAFDAYDKAHSDLGKAHTLFEIARSVEGHSPTDAAENLKEALVLYQRAKSKLGSANTVDTLASLERVYDVDQVRQSIATYRLIGAADSEAGTRNFLAFLLQSREDLESALSELDEAVTVARRAGEVSMEAVSIIVRGIVQRRSGDVRWRNTVLEGFALLETTFKGDESEAEGAPHLKDYILAETQAARAAARELAREAWLRRRRPDLVRFWLELPLHND